MLSLTRADFEDPRLVVFLEQHLRDMELTAPPESRHALDLDALRVPTVRVWVATDGAHLVGTVALAVVEPGHDELKSMRTDPARRGQGIATALLEHALADAATRGVLRVSLETGSADFFAPARALYEKAGFRACPPFGAYRDDPHSVYLTRAV